MPLHIDTLPIVKTADQAPRVRTFLFDVPDGLTWEPGTHIHVAIPGFNEGDQVRRELVRHMSVSTLPEEGYLGFTARLDSSDSLFRRTLAGYGVGNRLAFFKCGSILAFPSDDRPVVLLSRDVGVASMHAASKSFASRTRASSATRRKRSARRSSRSDRTAACPGPPRRKTGAPGAKRCPQV